MAILFLVPMFLFHGCKTSAKHPSLVEADLPKMVRLKELFFDVKPETSFKVSPDGKKIAWLGEKKRRTVIYFKTIGKNDIKSLSHNFIKGTIHFRTFYWAQDSRHIMYPMWEEFVDQHHIYVADTLNHTKMAQNLTPDKGHSYKLHQILRNDPEHIILQRYGSAETIIKTSTVDLVKLNILTARKKESEKTVSDLSSPGNNLEFVPAITRVMAKNPGNVYSWITDRKGDLAGRIVLKDVTQRTLEIKTPGTKSWRPILNWTIDDTVKFVSFSQDYKSIYLRSNVGMDRISLVKLDMASQKQTLITDNPTADIQKVLFRTVSGEPIAALAYPDYQKIHLLDPNYADIFSAFDNNEKQSIFIASADNQEKWFTLNIVTSQNIKRFLYHRDTKEKTLLATRFPLEYTKRLSVMKPISYESRDGTLINGYLTIPAGTSGKHLPMVLMVHGGPWSRDYWGLNRTVQLLANRGYVVLQVNFRGSSGYGRAFMTAAKGEFAGKMHTDLIDGVSFVVDQGIADPAKTAIYGYSYGGYASLTGLAFTPDVFACGVDVNGIANLETFLKSKDVKNDDFKIWYKWRTYVGDPENPGDLKAMKEKSPFHHINQITKPLLIVQGAKDKRVPRSEADAMVKALKQQGKQVDYILFPNESHYIRWWNNSFKMYNNIEIFLAQHLGGRKIHSDSIR